MTDATFTAIVIFITIYGGAFLIGAVLAWVICGVSEFIKRWKGGIQDNF